MALFSSPEKEFDKAESLISEARNARANNLTAKCNKLLEKAIEHMQKAAEGGCAKAMYRMAIYKTHGSIELLILSVPDSGCFHGLSWLQKAADQWHVYSMRDLGVYYYLNHRERNLAKSAEWLEKAYKLNSSAAFEDLISLYTYAGNKARLTELLEGACPQTEDDLRTWPYTRQLADLRREQGNAQCRPLYQALSAISDRHSLLCLGEMAEVDGDFSEAVEYYKKAYLSVEASLPTIFALSPRKDEFYQRAVRRKDTTAEALLQQKNHTPKAHLSRCAAANKGISSETLFQWYQTLADGGNLSAKEEVAFRYLFGNGIGKNEEIAVSIFKELQISGKASRNALATLGNFYTERKQYKEALSSFAAIEKAPISLDFESVYYARNYIRCLYETKDYAAALPRLETYVKAEGGRDLWATQALGLCYLNGWGLVSPGSGQAAAKKNEAVELFRQGAKAGYAPSWNSLGCCYHKGEGVAKNSEEAIRCYHKSRELDPKYPNPLYNLGIIYETGDGVKKDLSVAREWYKKSAALGYKLAQARLDVLDAAEKLQAEVKKNSVITPEKPASEPVATQISRTAVRKAEGYSARKELDSLIGLESVKKEIEMLEAVINGNALRRSRGLPEINVSLNMIFTGNAGTGKTTVARIVANILKENGLLAQGQLVETDRGGLVGQFIGDTAPKTTKKVKEAIGGVLFIDEVYSLVPEDSGRDYGPEAVSTLIKLMEDRKGEFAVIIAGYEKEMKHFIDSNPGLKSRFPTVIHFPDYTPEEMQMIFDRMSNAGNYIVSEGAKEKLMNLWQASADYSNLGNGRAVRNVFEKAQKLQLVRVLHEKIASDEKLSTFEAEDIPDAEEVFC